jgi:hypothetical protein
VAPTTDQFPTRASPPTTKQRALSFAAVPTGTPDNDTHATNRSSKDPTYSSSTQVDNTRLQTAKSNQTRSPIRSSLDHSHSGKQDGSHDRVIHDKTTRRATVTVDMASTSLLIARKRYSVGRRRSMEGLPPKLPPNPKGRNAFVHSARSTRSRAQSHK